MKRKHVYEDCEDNQDCKDCTEHTAIDDTDDTDDIVDVDIPMIISERQKEELKGLTDEQQRVVELALQRKNIFLTGAGGVGKSFLLKYLVQILREQGLRVQVTATTGIAAVSIGGQVLHAFSGIGIAEENIDVICHRARSQRLKTIWNSLDVLIIDEISMLTPDYFRKLDATAKIARQNQAEFGGIQLLLVGDFFQLPPVHTGKLETGTPRFVFEIPLWKKCVHHSIELTKVFRQEEATFVESLMRIRVGAPEQMDYRMLMSRVHAVLPADGIEPTFLHSHTKEVDELNEQRMKALKTPAKLFQMTTGIDQIKIETQMKTPGKQTSVSQVDLDRTKQRLIHDVPVPEQLVLKEQCQVMLVVNLSVEHGLINGSRGYISGFTEKNYPIVRFATTRVIIHPYKWQVQVGNKYVWVGQIPLRLAYAFTIHKSQSQSLDRVALQLDRVFDYGQAYVALSRCRSLEGLTLKSFKPDCIKAHPEVLKFYQELKHERKNL